MDRNVPTWALDLQDERTPKRTPGLSPPLKRTFADAHGPSNLTPQVGCNVPATGNAAVPWPERPSGPAGLPPAIRQLPSVPRSPTVSRPPVDVKLARVPPAVTWSKRPVQLSSANSRSASASSSSEHPSKRRSLARLTSQSSQIAGKASSAVSVEGESQIRETIELQFDPRITHNNSEDDVDDDVVGDDELYNTSLDRRSQPGAKRNKAVETWVDQVETRTRNANEADAMEDSLAEQESVGVMPTKARATDGQTEGDYELPLEDQEQTAFEQADRTVEDWVRRDAERRAYLQRRILTKPPRVQEEMQDVPLEDDEIDDQWIQDQVPQLTEEELQQRKEEDALFQTKMREHQQKARERARKQAQEDAEANRIQAEKDTEAKRLANIERAKRRAEAESQRKEAEVEARKQAQMNAPRYDRANNSEYRLFFNAQAQESLELTHTQEYAEDILLEGSYFGGTLWTADDKEAFFAALSRYGKNIIAIAAALHKSIPEVALYVDELDQGLERQRMFNIDCTANHIAAAHDVPDEITKGLESSADALAWEQWKHDIGLEVELHGERWLVVGDDTEDARAREHERLQQLAEGSESNTDSNSSDSDYEDGPTIPLHTMTSHMKEQAPSGKQLASIAETNDAEQADEEPYDALNPEGLAEAHCTECRIKRVRCSREQPACRRCIKWGIADRCVYLDVVKGHQGKQKGQVLSAMAKYEQRILAVERYKDALTRACFQCYKKRRMCTMDKPACANCASRAGGEPCTYRPEVGPSPKLGSYALPDAAAYMKSSPVLSKGPAYSLGKRHQLWFRRLIANQVLSEEDKQRYLPFAAMTGAQLKARCNALDVVRPSGAPQTAEYCAMKLVQAGDPGPEHDAAKLRETGSGADIATRKQVWFSHLTQEDKLKFRPWAAMKKADLQARMEAKGLSWPKDIPHTTLYYATRLLEAGDTGPELVTRQASHLWFKSLTSEKQAKLLPWATLPAHQLTVRCGVRGIVITKGMPKTAENLATLLFEAGDRGPGHPVEDGSAEEEVIRTDHQDVGIGTRAAVHTELDGKFSATGNTTPFAHMYGPAASQPHDATAKIPPVEPGTELSTSNTVSDIKDGPSSGPAAVPVDARNTIKVDIPLAKASTSGDVAATDLQPQALIPVQSVALHAPNAQVDQFRDNERVELEKPRKRLLRTRALLHLSKTLFMNSSDPDYDYRTHNVTFPIPRIISGKRTHVEQQLLEPAMFRSALDDLTEYVKDVTRELVSVIYQQTCSRMRREDDITKDALEFPVVKEKDVRDAAEILKMSTSRDAYWASFICRHNVQWTFDVPDPNNEEEMQDVKVEGDMVRDWVKQGGKDLKVLFNALNMKYAAEMQQLGVKDDGWEAKDVEDVEGNSNDDGLNNGVYQSEDEAKCVEQESEAEESDLGGLIHTEKMERFDRKTSKKELRCLLRVLGRSVDSSSDSEELASSGENNAHALRAPAEQAKRQAQQTQANGRSESVVDNQPKVSSSDEGSDDSGSEEDTKSAAAVESAHSTQQSRATGWGESVVNYRTTVSSSEDEDGSNDSDDEEEAGKSTTSGNDSSEEADSDEDGDVKMED